MQEINMKTTNTTLSPTWNMYVITLSGERYYIIKQEEFITLSGENYYIIRWCYYIVMQLLHYQVMLLHCHAVITLSGRCYINMWLYIIGCNIGLVHFRGFHVDFLHLGMGRPKWDSDWFDFIWVWTKQKSEVKMFRHLYGHKSKMATVTQGKYRKWHISETLLDLHLTCYMICVTYYMIRIAWYVFIVTCYVLCDICQVLHVTCYVLHYVIYVTCYMFHINMTCYIHINIIVHTEYYVLYI